MALVWFIKKKNKIQTLHLLLSKKIFKYRWISKSLIILWNINNTLTANCIWKIPNPLSPSVTLFLFLLHQKVQRHGYLAFVGARHALQLTYLGIFDVLEYEYFWKDNNGEDDNNDIITTIIICIITLCHVYTRQRGCCWIFVKEGGRWRVVLRGCLWLGIHKKSALLVIVSHLIEANEMDSWNKN